MSAQIFYFFVDDNHDSSAILPLQEALWKWEKLFNMHYILPVLGDLANHLNYTMEAIVADDKQGISYLL